MKTQMTINSNFKGISDCFKFLLEEGKTSKFKLQPFFKGILPTLACSAPNSGISLLSYELLKELYYGKFPTEEPKAGKNDK
jgi:hypothetical protein